jgi:GTP cyclohydrolase II
MIAGGRTCVAGPPVGAARDQQRHMFPSAFIHPRTKGTTRHCINQASCSSDGDVWTEFVAETLLPTNMGKFRLRGYRHTIDSGRTFSEPSAIISGAVEGGEDIVLRVHDACWTSEVIGSLKCDCREQLHLAMRYVQDQPPGLVIYCQQEGRGIGLANKIAAYALQERGLDTVQANRALGLPDDCREYSAVRHILKDLGIKSIRLMTNNPRKINELESMGIIVSGRVPCIVEAGEYNQGYLDTKEKKMQHLLSVDEELNLDGSYCYWNHEGEPGSSGVAMKGVKSGVGLQRGTAEVDAALKDGSIQERPEATRQSD